MPRRWQYHRNKVSCLINDIHIPSDNVLSKANHIIVRYEVSVLPLVKLWVLWNMTLWRFY